MRTKQIKLELLPGTIDFIDSLPKAAVNKIYSNFGKEIEKAEAIRADYYKFKRNTQNGKY